VSLTGPAGLPAVRAFARLSRRIRTLIVSGTAFLILFVLTITMPVPYSILTPGPTYNTLGKDNQGATIIVIKGAPTKQTTGNLNMTTVFVTGKDEKETA